MTKIWIMNHYANDMWKNKGGRHYSFAENLINFGYEPVILCASSFHNSNQSVDLGRNRYKIDRSDKIPFVFVKTPTAVGNGINRVKNMYSFYYNLMASYKSILTILEKPDLIIASSVHPLTMIAGIRIAKKLNIPCICEVRDLWPEAIFSFGRIRKDSFIGKALVRGEHWIYKNADSIVFTKEGDIDYLKEKKWLSDQGGDIRKDKCFYINNGVDINKFNNNISNNVIDDPDLVTDTFKVIYCGAIRPVNNVGKIVDAANIMKTMNDITFLIYGEGNEKEKLEKQVITQGLSNIKFKGYVDKQSIPYILSKSNLNILNYSQKEYNWSRGNSSNKLFEYMASGKPILSTVSMGYSIINKYGCGKEIYDASSNEIAREILNFKNMNADLYEQTCENSLKGAEDFDYVILTKKLIDVINSTLSYKKYNMED